MSALNQNSFTRLATVNVDAGLTDPKVLVLAPIDKKLMVTHVVIRGASANIDYKFATYRLKS